MAFWARTFVFDDIPSETFGLFIISEDAAGVIATSGSNSVELFTQEVYRRPKPYFFGTQQTPVLEFSLSFASLTPVDAQKQRQIQKWLFGHSEYKKLQVMQCDMDDVYFNCIMTNPEVTTIGNYAYTFKCDVVCDAPWAWGFPHTTTYGPFITEGTFSYNNTTDNNFYTYPEIVITLSSTGAGITLINTSDNNSTTTFDSLLQDEVLTINSDLSIIKSSTGLRRFSNFGGVMPRLVRGMNEFQVLGDIESISIIMQDAKKVIG